jgi:hypothetical protein
MDQRKKPFQQKVILEKIASNWFWDDWFWCIGNLNKYH